MTRRGLIAAFWIALAVTGVLYGAMLVLTLPELLAGPERLRPFDARPFGYDLAEARAYLAALDAEGRALYLGLQRALDTAFPAANAVTLALAAMLLFRGWARGVLLVLIIGLTASDYAENAAVAEMLRTGPEDLDAAQVGRASLWTVLKSVGTMIVWVALLVGLVRAWKGKRA